MNSVSEASSIQRCLLRDLPRQAAVGVALALACIACRDPKQVANANEPALAVTAEGTYRPTTASDGVVAYLDVPYAQPPVGDLRWQEPRPLAPSTLVRDATAFGHTCRQAEDEHEPASREPQGEDCLSLNVWTRHPRGTPKPVMVWIHGGANVSGGSADPSTNGHNFVRDNDVVLVSINYRLGPFGFLDLSEVGGPDYARSRNLGLLDQLAALRWVREHIGAFGGDARNVTVFGESAGGSAVMRLIAMPLALGLFDKAIIESGGPANIRVRGVKDRDLANAALDLTRDFMRKARVADVAGLQALTADSVLATAAVLAREKGDLMGVSTWGARADSVVLPRDVFGDVRRGVNPDVKVLIGTNEDEMLYFRLYDADFERSLMREYREKSTLMGRDVRTVKAIADRYLAGSEDPMRYVDLAGEFWLRQPSILFAEGRSRVNDTYMYLWTWDSHVPGMGAAHAIELPFVFGNLTHPVAVALAGPDLPARLSRRVQAAWAAFAASGDPSVPGEIPWPRYREDARETLVIDEGAWKVVRDPKGDARRLLGAMFDVGR